MAIIKCQYKWLKWLDNDATYVRVLIIFNQLMALKWLAAYRLLYLTVS